MTATKPKEEKLIDWQAYVDQLRPILRLADWEVRVSPLTCEDDNLATISPTFGQKRASIRLCDGWADLEPEVQRCTIAHELIHCHLHAPLEMATEDIEHFMSAGEKEMFTRGFRRTVEYAVDGLADTLAPFLPLPTKG